MSHRNKPLTPAVLATEDLPPVRVDVPEWGGHLFVRGFTAADSCELDAALADEDDGLDRSVRVAMTLVRLSACDQDGNRLFGKNDVKALSGKSAKAISRIAQAAREINGLGEEPEKNSGTGPAAGS